MKTKRKFAVTGAMGVLLSAGTLAIASPAFAYGVGDCEDKNLACIWEDKGGQGTEYGHQSAIGRWDIGSWNGDNEISAAVNSTSYCMRLWNNDDWSGSYVDIAPKSEKLNLGSFDNKAESWQLYKC